MCINLQAGFFVCLLSVVLSPPYLRAFVFVAAACNCVYINCSSLFSHPPFGIAEDDAVGFFVCVCVGAKLKKNMANAKKFEQYIFVLPESERDN